MKKVKLGGHKVEIYDSIDELPMVRFHKYSKMLMVDAGVGSDINDFDAFVLCVSGGLDRREGV